MKYRKVSKRYFALLMVFVFIVALLPGTAWAAGDGGPVTSAATPVFTTDLSPGVVPYIVGAAAAALTVAAVVADGGAITYQWYSNTVNGAEGGAAIAGETAASYTPPTTVAGTVYYYAIATNTLEASTATATSSIAAVTVTEAQTAEQEGTEAPAGAAAPEETPASAATPSFTTDLSPGAVTYTVGAAAAALTVAAVVADGGAITYQWYSNTVYGAEGGAAIAGETAASYTPPTTVAGTVYYYAIATNTLEASTATAISSIAAVTVTGKAVYDPSAFEAELAAREAEKAAREAAAEQEYLDMLRQAGVELDSFTQMRALAAPVTLAQEGDFLGYVTISLERFVAGTGYVMEPVSYPLYAGDTIADIVHGIAGYKDLTYNLPMDGYYTNAGSLDRDFVLTGLADPSPPADAVPDEIRTAAAALGGQVVVRQTSGWLKNGDLYSTGRWLLWVNNELKETSFLTDFSSAPAMQTLRPGDVIRLQYSVTGDGRDLGAGASRLYDVADRDRLTRKVAELNSWGQDLLTVGAYRSAYDGALAVLKDLKATQQQVDSALLALLNEPVVDLGGVPIDNTKDMLMGNIEGRVRLGGEWEVTALDVPRANDGDRNFVRGDLNLEVVQGKDLVSIRRAPGSSSGATSNSNMSRGYTFFVKGLKQGLARIKVSYPTYQGRETYIVIHVTDRDSDYTNALHMSSSLDYVTKYDTIHYDARTQNYPITIDVPFLALNLPGSPTLIMYVNGSYVDPTIIKPSTYMSGQTFFVYSPSIPLHNGYNTVIISASSGGVQQTRVYQIRASRLTVTLENETRPSSTAIYAGDSVKVHFTGLVNPLPKISRLYNPSQGQVSYNTDMPFLTQLYGSSSQYDVATSTVSFTATDAGDYSLHGGFLRMVVFGGSGWLETPISQIPAYRGRPVMTVGGGGPNVPQNFMSFSFLPDVTFTVLEDPAYNPVRVAAAPDKEVYAPGDTVTISIPDLDIAGIQSHHNFWDEIVDDSSQVPGSQYFQCTAITQASVVYSTDIPGLETVRSREFVDVKKIIDNIRLHTPIYGADGTTEIHVINNYEAGAPVADLVPLKTLTFKIPDTTPSGTYKLKGGYVDVEYGPYWWVKYVTYFGGEIADVAITVQGAVAPGDMLDGKLMNITIDSTTAFLYDPRQPGGNTITGDAISLDMAYIMSSGGTFNWTSIHNALLMKVFLGGKSDGATLEYRGADGLPVTEYFKNSLLSIYLPKIPLQLGDNQFTLTVYPQEGSTAPPTTYTFNVERVVDSRIIYHAELDELRYTTASPNTDIPETPGPEKGIIIQEGQDYTSGEPGKSYIEVGYQVEKILLSARARDPETNFEHLYKSYLNIAKLTANGIGFGEGDTYHALFGISSPLAAYPLLEEPIPLQVGENVITIHIEARDRIDAEDPGVAADHYLYVTRLPDVSLKTVEVGDGRLEAGGFYPGIGTIKVATSGNAEGKFEMTFTATAGAVISRGYPATDIITPGVPAAFEAPEPIVSSTAAETPKRYPIFVTKTVGGREIVTKYEIVAYRASETTSGETFRYSPSSGSKVSLTDAVKDDDSNPDGVFRALTGAYKTQLGLMGGFVEYKLDRPIENDPHNKYGIDFVIYGTVTSAFDAFPGTVQVARDGNGDGQPDQWYTLAGSEYYSDGTENNLSVTYQKQPTGLVYFDDSGQRAGQLSLGQGYYPDPVFSSRWNSIVTSETSTTFTGTLLSTRNPAFGYADVYPIGLNGARPSQPDKPVNPYRAGDLYSGTRGDGFDLAWAVDENGLPVELGSVDFIRVSSSYLSSSATDVNGTVLTSIVDVTGEGTSVGEAYDLQGLKVNGQDFPLEQGVYVYELPLSGPQDVRISAATFGSNFYVDGEALGHEMESAPIHFDGTTSRVVRLIVQSEEKTPKIYYLVLEPKIEINTIALDKTSVELRVGEQIRLTPIITPSSANTARTVTWLSTSPVVASVSNDGLVTALLVGTATIQAQIGSKWTQCSVRVLPAEQNADQAAANAVIALIDQIPDGAKRGDAAVTAARAAYDLLTAAQKALVTNYAKLTAAEANVPSGGGNMITVTFRLIGDTKHGAPADNPESTAYHVAYVNWIKTTSYTLPENSTNYDLFAMAMSAAHLNFTSEGGFGYEHNYISGIQSPIDGEMLSEFDNGRWSGWMYTVNGVHPNIGLAAKVLANGDRVVWHYMDNFYVELDKQAWLAVPDTDPRAESTGPGGGGNGPVGGQNPSASLAPKATVKDGTAAASVSASDIAAAIRDAKAKGSTSIVIAPEITGAANRVSVDIPKSSLSSIASETEAGLVVETPVGSLSIPGDALASIASQAQGGTVTVSLATVDTSSLTVAQREAVGDDPVYDVNVLSGGTHISGFGGGSVTVSLPYALKEGEDPAHVTVWYLNDAGELERVACSYDPATGMATFNTDHLSYYVVGYAEAAPPPVPGQSFSDVRADDWFYDSVVFAVYRGLMNGTSAATFSPNDPMTRAMLVTVLYRLEGSPQVTGGSSFTDVKESEWYTEAVAWASAEGIVTGYGGGLFGTNDSITRQQLATILYRYAGYKNYDTSRTTDLAPYTDAPEIGPWAVDALQWANASGLITGRTATTLAPGGSATRAEVAAILQRFVVGVVR